MIIFKRSFIHPYYRRKQAPFYGKRTARFIRRRNPAKHSQRIVSVNVVPPAPPVPPSPVFSAINNRAVVGTPATIGALRIFAGYFDNAAMISLSPGLMTASNGAIIWNPVMQGAQTFTIAVNGMPTLRNTTFIIPITGYREVGRLASVNATTQLGNSAFSIRVIIVDKILITSESRLSVLTIGQNFQQTMADPQKSLEIMATYVVGRPAFVLAGRGLAFFHLG